MEGKREFCFLAQRLKSLIVIIDENLHAIRQLDDHLFRTWGKFSDTPIPLPPNTTTTTP